MAKERTTQEVIETLGDDFHRCHREFLDALEAESPDDDGSVAIDPYCARQMVRAFFAYVEAVVLSVKASSAAHCMDHGIPITPQERFLAVDIAHVLDEKGELVEQPARLNLARNVHFAFTLAARADGRGRRFDPGLQWWSCFKKSIKVRDRLTHPKLPGDLDIAADEIIDLLKAKEGFEKVVLSYRRKHKAGRTKRSARRARKTARG